MASGEELSLPLTSATGKQQAPAGDSASFSYAGGDGTQEPEPPALAGQGPAPLSQQVSEDAPTVIRKALPRAGESDLRNLVRGKRLAHFELEEAIGVGGMAAVIRARDVLLDRPVALKILPPEMAANPENVARFHNEARAAARLDHENIARVYYCGEDQGLHFIAFEFVEGQNLRQMIEAHGRLPVAEALHYTLQVATGLAHAAQRGVVHRDIKPSNIIVGPNGRAKLVDMGLARHLEQPAELTQTGVTLGTFDYISPEQALEPRQADIRSDIYSLGCTLYHMLTGRPPFPGGTAARKLQYHQSAQPVDPRQLNPEVPDEVAALLARMMAKDPRDRYQRPEELVHHLLAVLHKLTGMTPSAGSDVLFVESPVPSPPRTWPALVAGGTILAAVLLLFSLVQLLPPGVEEPEKAAQSADTSPAKGVRPSAGSSAGTEGPSRSPPNAPRRTGYETVVVRNARELAEALRRVTQGTILLDPPEDRMVFDMTRSAETDGDWDTEPAGDAEPDIVIEYRHWQSATQLPTLRLQSVLQGEPRTAEAALFRIRGGSWTFRGLRFEVDAVHLPISALEVSDGRLTLERCDFVQLRQGKPTTDAKAEPSVYALRVRPLKGAAPRSSIEIKHCLFTGGPAAVVLEDGVPLQIVQSYFAPYACAILMQGSNRSDARYLLHVQECRAVQMGGVFVLVDTWQDAALTLRHCVFSDLSRNGSGEEAALIGLGPVQDAGRLRWTSVGNYYHNYRQASELFGEYYWPEGLVGPLAPAPRVRDFGSVFTTVSPWVHSGLSDALSSGSPLSLSRALFEVRKDLLPAGRNNEISADARHDDTAPAASNSQSNERRELIVDGQGFRPGTYRSLSSAVSEAPDGAVILVRQDGVIREAPILVRGKKLTLRPAPGCKPVIVPDITDSADPDAALVRVVDAQVTFEDLELSLTQTSAVSLSALVSLPAGGKVRLQRCVVTLDADAAGLRLSDPGGTMMGGTGTKVPVPSVELDQCLVRGKGDLLRGQPSRPFTCELKQSAIALDGSLAVLDGNKPGALALGECSFDVQDCTVYLTQHLLWLRNSLMQPVQVPVRDCALQRCLVLGPAGSGSALVRLDGVQGQENIRGLFQFRGQKNVYSWPGPLLQCQPTDQMDAMPQRFDFTRWSDLWSGSESESRPWSVRLAGLPPADGSLLRVEPQDFRVVIPAGELVNRYGVSVEQLPQPRRDKSVP